MVPLGYLAKHVVKRPDWLKAKQVESIYSVSGCVSTDFADYIGFWKHNGFWFFNTPSLILKLAREQDINLSGTTLFYYEGYEFQADTETAEWERYSPEPSFKTKVLPPENKILAGYDIVSFTMGNSPECSYLSCNHMAQSIKVNRYCLVESLETAKNLLNKKAFLNCEPGPCRIIAVYSCPNWKELI